MKIARNITIEGYGFEVACEDERAGRRFATAFTSAFESFSTDAALTILEFWAARPLSPTMAVHDIDGDGQATWVGEDGHGLHFDTGHVMAMTDAELSALILATLGEVFLLASGEKFESARHREDAADRLVLEWAAV